jgi:hypothetical protein
VPTSSVHPEAESIHPALSASSSSSSSSSESYSQPFSCTGSLSRPLRYISAARTLSSAQRQGDTGQTRLVFPRPVNSKSRSLEARTNLYVRVRNSRSYTACMSRNTVKVDFLVLGAFGSKTATRSQSEWPFENTRVDMFRMTVKSLFVDQFSVLVVSMVFAQNPCVLQRPQLQLKRRIMRHGCNDGRGLPLLCERYSRTAGSHHVVRVWVRRRADQSVFQVCLGPVGVAFLCAERSARDVRSWRRGGTTRRGAVASAGRTHILRWTDAYIALDGRIYCAGRMHTTV